MEGWVVPRAGCSSLRIVITALWWRLTGLEPWQRAETRIEGQKNGHGLDIISLSWQLKTSTVNTLLLLIPYAQNSRSGRCWRTGKKNILTVSLHLYKHKPHSHCIPSAGIMRRHSASPSVCRCVQMCVSAWAKVAMQAFAAVITAL